LAGQPDTLTSTRSHRVRRRPRPHHAPRRPL